MFFFETIHKIKSLNPNLDTTELTKNLINYSMLYFKLNSKDQKLSIYGYEDFLNNLVGYFEKAQKEDFFKNKKWDCTRIGEDKNLHHSAYAALALDFMSKNGFKKTDFENEETRYAIMSLLDTKIWGTDMIYHAFNSYNLQSIKENGLLNPIIVRQKENNRYELIDINSVDKYISHYFYSDTAKDNKVQLYNHRCNSQSPLQKRAF